MPTLTPVDFNPFEQQQAQGPKLTPVDFNPFEQAPPQEQPGMLDQIGRQLGLTARYGMEGAANLAGMVSDPFSQFMGATPLGQLATQGADAMGLPSPQGGLEEGVGNASKALVGSGITMGAGSVPAIAERTGAVIQAALPAATARAAPIVSKLSEQPLMQALSTITGAGAQEVAKASGVGEGGQLAAGIAGGLLPAGGSTLVETLNPSNATARLVNAFAKKANAGPLAKEGEAVAQKTGIEFTPAQVNADPSMTMAENMARQSIFSRSTVAEGDRKRVGQLVTHLEKTLDGISKSGASPDIAGKQVQNAAKNVIKRIEDTRHKVASEDFGKVDRLVAGAPTVKAKSFDSTLASLIEENSVAPKGSGQRAIADALTDLRGSHLRPSGGHGHGAPKPNEGVTRAPRAAEPSLILGPNGKPAFVTPGETGPQLRSLRMSDLLKTRRYLSQVAGGAATLAGATDKPMQKRAAAMLLKALDDDIENSAGEIGGEVGAALSKANKNYKAFSDQLEAVEKSPLRSILGEDLAGAVETGSFNTVAPEKVMAKLSGMTPTELGITRKLLERDNPEAWATFKRGYLESAIEKAKEMPSSMGVNTPIMRPNAFVKNVGDQKKLEAIYSPAEVSEINAAVNASRRLGDSTGYNFSGTAPANEALGFMNKVAAGGLKGIAQVAGMALGTKKLAKLMNDNKGRAALMEITRVSPTSARYKELAAQIGVIAGAGDE